MYTLLLYSVNISISIFLFLDCSDSFCTWLTCFKVWLERWVGVGIGFSGVHQIFVKPELRLNPSPVNINFF